VRVASGQVFSFCLYLAASAVLLWSITAGRRGRQPRVREIAGLQAIEEAVGRSAEMGKPVHYSLGIGGLIKSHGPMTLAGLSVLGHVAQVVARYDVQLIVTVSQPEVLPLASDIVRQAFANEGKQDLYQIDTVRFLSTNQFAYAAGVMGLVQREKVAANIMMGWFAGESMLLAEAGHEAGGIQIAGTANISQLPFFAASCDYTLIGEELYVAGAVLSGDAVQLASIKGQDIIKILLWLLAALGTISVALGSAWLKSLMAK